MIKGNNKMSSTFFKKKNVRAAMYMMHIKSVLFASIMAFFTPASPLRAQSAKTLTVKANEIRGTVQPTMWGVFFEDINMGADGGIYAELIKNRSFEFFKPMMGWKVLGKPLTEGDFLIMNR